MNLLILSLRNIFRNRRRTSITLLAVVSGMTGIIVFGGFIEFAFWGLRESTIRTQLGHLQVYKSGYSEKGIADPEKYIIKNPDPIVRRILSMPGVKTVAKRLTFSCLISTGDKTLTGKGIGIDVEMEEEFTAFETIVDGYPLYDDTPDGGVVGLELMKALDAKVGDHLTIMTTTITGAINAIDFRVVGVAQTGSQEYDSVFVKLPIKAVQRLLDTEGAEKLLILLDDTKKMESTISLLEKLREDMGEEIEFKSWYELAYFYKKVVNLYNGIFDVVKVIIALIVLFSIANTMTMSIFERVREIGTLRAVGTTKNRIVAMFVVEGVMIGVLGCILGSLVGVSVALAINYSGGIYIPPPPGMSRGYLSMIMIVPSVIAYSCISTLIVATLSSIYPAFQASRLKIVEALQHT